MADSPGATLEPRFVTGDEMLIGGVNERYTFETRTGIPEQWRRFGPQVGAVPGQVGRSAYGVCWKYKPGIGFDYLTGVKVSDLDLLPEGYEVVKLDARRYAVFDHMEHVSKIPATLDAIWTTWLPTSGHQAADAPCFERYTTEYDPTTGMGGTEIWIPLQS